MNKLFCSVKTTTLFLVVAIFFLFSASVVKLKAEELASVKIGEVAPVFTLENQLGGKISLSDFKGKIVVLEWFNHECPFVKKHYRSNNMQRLQKKYLEKGVIWLIINSSAPGKQGHLNLENGKKILEENNAAPSALLFDADGKVGVAYGAKTTPHMFIVDSAGNLRYKGAIDNVKSTREGDIEGAKNYVTQALDQLLNGKEVSESSTEPYGCSVKYS
jgi:hypothetical protein